MPSQPATYEPGGMLRCCVEAIPVNDKGIVAGKEHEHRPCAHCTDGVYFLGGSWISRVAYESRKEARS